MDTVIDFFTRQKKLALVFTLSIILVGLIISFQIQRDQFPIVDLETMIVSASYSGNSPEDVELNITNLIEDELRNISGIKSYESTSKEGGMSIIIVLEPDLDDINEVKQEIKDAVNRIKNFPTDLDNLPRVFDAQPTHGIVLQVNLGDKTADYQQMRHIVNQLERELAKVDGVSQVTKSGYLEQEVRIYLNLEKIEKYQITLQEVLSVILAKNQRYTAGHSNSQTDERNFVVLSKFNTLDEVKNVIVHASFDGPEIRLKDIANIVIGNEQEESITRVNGKKGFILSIRKQENADIIKTVERIKEKIKEQQQYLPKTLEIFYTNDQSYLVKNRLRIVSNNGMIGLGLVLIVLSVFLSIRTAFWVAISLPVVIFGMVILLRLFDETINLVSLAAVILVLGLVVDDSIIIAESIHHYRGKIKDKYQATVIGFKRVISPILITMLTTILAFSSMFLMSGTLGKFIYVMPLVVIFALIISFFEIIVALPAHLAGSDMGTERTWFHYFEQKFKIINTVFLRFRYVIILLFMVIFAGSIWLGLQMKFTLFPEVGTDKISVKFELSPGSSLHKTEEKVKLLEKLITEVVGEELDFLSTKVGKRFDHIARLEIILKPASTRKRTGRDIHNDLLKATVEKMSNVGKIRYFIRKPGPPIGSDVEINLIGNDNKQRQEASNHLAKILSGMTGFSDLDRDDELGKKRIEIKLNYNKIGRLELDLNTISQYLKSALNGIKASHYRDGEDEIDFVIYLGQNKTIKKLKIPNKQGRLIPMTQFAQLNYIEGESNYNHYNGQRSVRLSGNVDSTKNTANVIIQQALKSLDLKKNYPDIYADLSGGIDESQQSVQDFAKAFGLSIIGIYLLLMLLFNSYTQPLLVIATIPLSIVGIIVAFHLHGQSLSFFAMLGALALVGVIVNDGLILINHLNFLAKEQIKNPFIQSTKERISWIVQGAKDRLRAVLLTTLTTLAGVIPLAYGIGGIDFILQPMALALGYGLVFGTVMTLILMPALYLINLEIRAKFTKNDEQ